MLLPPALAAAALRGYGYWITLLRQMTVTCCSTASDGWSLVAPTPSGADQMTSAHARQSVLGCDASRERAPTSDRVKAAAQRHGSTTHSQLFLNSLKPPISLTATVFSVVAAAQLHSQQ